MRNLAIVILAAGKSTRMRSKTSKALHKLAGLPILTYAVREAVKLKPKKIVIVGSKCDEAFFVKLLGKGRLIEYCIQAEALGTGHAVSKASRLLNGFDGYVLILLGDVPLIQAKTLEEFILDAEKEGADCAFLSTRFPDPTGYGRILRDVAGKFVAIREHKDATDSERMVDEINSGIVLLKSNWLFKRLRKIRPDNAQKEYYLTDIVELSDSADDRVTAHCKVPFEQFLGVNDRFDLARVNQIMYSSIARHWMERGVTILDPDQTYIDYNVGIGEDTTIGPFSFLKGETNIGSDCVVENGVVIEDSVVGDGVHIKPYTVIEKSRIKDGAIVGPFSRLRPEAVLEKGVRVGNFVEIKKSILKDGVKANHLSYIGDATIGARTNVGCGTITCNYNGKKKHRTVVGEEVFIGSDVQFVAPVKIGKGATIGAGSTITNNVPPKSLALCRAKQVNISNWRAKRRKGKSKAQSSSRSHCEEPDRTK